MNDAPDFYRSDERLEMDDFDSRDRPGRSHDPNQPDDAARPSQWRERMLWLLEVTIATAGVIAGVTLLPRSASVGIAAIAFSLFGATATLISRRGAWQTSKLAMTDELDIAIAIAERRQRAGWAGLLVCAAALFFLVVVIVSSQLTGAASWEAARSTSSAERLLLVVAAACAFIGVTMIACVVGLRRAVATTAELTRQRDEIEDNLC